MHRASSIAAHATRLQAAIPAASSTVISPVVTIATHSQQLIWIEVGYAFLGALLVGAIVGAVPRRVFLKDAD